MLKLKCFLLVIILISCKKVENKKMLSIICSKKIYNNERLKIKITNNSNQDYFIIMDTVNYYDMNPAPRSVKKL